MTPKPTGGCTPTPEPKDELRKKIEELDIDFGYACGNLGEDCKDDTVERIMQLIRTEVLEAEEETQKRIEYEAHQRAFKKMRDELERVSHPTIKVIRNKSSYFEVENIEDVKYGGDIIQIVIADQFQANQKEEAR